MRRHFVRLYLSIAAAALAAAALVFAIGRLHEPDDRADPAMWQQAEVSVREEFAKSPPSVASRAISNRYRVRAELLPPDAPPPPSPQTLGLRARLWPPPPQRQVTLDDGRRVQLVWERPPPALGPPGVALLVLLASGAVLLVWLGRLERSLGELVRVAEQFGAHDLSARVREDPNKPTVALDHAFNQMATRVDALVKAREDLLAGVSHELRTPLMRVRFALELLHDSDDPHDRERRIADIQSDVQEIDALIGEILEFARVGTADALRVESLDADPLLEQVAAELRRLVPDRSVVVEPHGVTLRADRRLVLRALRNLATNAARHGAGVVTLSATAVGDDVTLAVCDQGAGIPLADRARALEPFVRLDATRQDGGLGLGLALTDRIAKLHGGRVEIGEATGGGARVALVVPTAGPAARG